MLTPKSLLRLDGDLRKLGLPIEGVSIDKSGAAEIQGNLTSAQRKAAADCIAAFDGSAEADRDFEALQCFDGDVRLQNVCAAVVSYIFEEMGGPIYSDRNIIDGIRRFLKEVKEG